MAREAMVTRTMLTTKVNVLCLEIEKAEPFNKDIVLAGTYKDAKSLMKAVSANIDNDKQKAVVVTTSEVVETLYGMKEADFIKNAVILPARVKKEQETENAQENE